MVGSQRKRFIPGLLGSMLCSAFAVCPALHSSPAAASDVRSMFDLSHPAGSPFPSDRFTVSHSGQNTGLRINLEEPEDCAARRTDCEHIDLLNELDGFNVQPRLSVPFSGPIDVKTVDGRSISLVRLGSALDPATSNWRVIEINQSCGM